MERYQDKVVLITGAGDVAEAAAKRLLCEGAKVAFSDFSQEALDAAISGLKAEGWDGERLMGIKCDVRKYEECEAAANAVLARWGQIDTLVATAGIIRHCPIDEMTEAQWQDVVDINLTGVFHAVKSVGPLHEGAEIRTYRGHLLHWRSDGPSGVGVNYAATKAGVNGLVMCLGYELGPWQITVNSVAPGPLKGKMFAGMTQDRIESLSAGIRLQRMGELSDVAAAIAYLGSDDAAWTTGEVLDVNGGLQY